jgi:hypothetical protein
LVLTRGARDAEQVCVCTFAKEWTDIVRGSPCFR